MGAPFDAAHARLRELLYARFRERPLPILMGDGFGIPGASMWTGARLWVDRLRELGLERGERVVVALPPSPVHVMVTIACWWEGLVLVPRAPVSCCGSESGGACASACGERPGARAGVGFKAGAGVQVPLAGGGPGRRVALEGSVASRSDGPGVLVVFETGSGEVACGVEHVLGVLEAGAARGASGQVCEQISELGWHDQAGLLGEAWSVLSAGGVLTVRADAGADAARCTRSHVSHGFAA